MDFVYKYICMKACCWFFFKEKCVSLYMETMLEPVECLKSNSEYTALLGSSTCKLNSKGVGAAPAMNLKAFHCCKVNWTEILALALPFFPKHTSFSAFCSNLFLSIYLSYLV